MLPQELDSGRSTASIVILILRNVGSTRVGIVCRHTVLILRPCRLRLACLKSSGSLLLTESPLAEVHLPHLTPRGGAAHLEQIVEPCEEHILLLLRERRRRHHCLSKTSRIHLRCSMTDVLKVQVTVRSNLDLHGLENLGVHALLQDVV